jgi:hypothetical protein
MPNDLSIFEHINDLSEPFSGAFGASKRFKINQFKTNGWLAEIHSLLAEQSVVSYLLEQSNAKLARMNANPDQIDNRLAGTIDVRCQKAPRSRGRLGCFRPGGRLASV